MRLPDINTMSSLDHSSTGSVHSEDWRTREAKDIFNLLQNEYNSSKKLNMLKRYKELERIINMFTSEPVLTKLLWLASDDLETSSSRSSSDRDDGAEKRDDEDQQNDDVIAWQRGQTVVPTKVFGYLRNFTTKLKSAVPFAASLSTSSTTDATSELDLSTYPLSKSPLRVPHLDVKNVSRLLVNTPPQSCVSTPGCQPLSSPSNTSFVFNVGPAFDFETSSYRTSTSDCDTIDNTGIFFSTTTSNGCSNLRENRVSVSSKDYDSGKENAHDSLSQSQRRGIERCVIRRDEIPLFQIPPQRTSVTEKSYPTINPSLYRDSSSAIKSPCFHGCKKNITYPLLKVSMSTPNMIIHRSMSSIGPKLKAFINGNCRQKRCCSDNCIHNCSSMDSPNLLEDCSYVSAFPQHERNMNSSFLMNGVCQEAMDSFSPSDLLKAHESLSNMKREFKALNDKSLLARYKKMKSIIKSCMEVQL